jgi:hypothetical protein
MKIIFWGNSTAVNARDGWFPSVRRTIVAHSARPAGIPTKMAALKPPFHKPNDPNQALTATLSGDVAATASGLGVVWPFISATGGGITASA